MHKEGITNNRARDDIKQKFRETRPWSKHNHFDHLFTLECCKSGRKIINKNTGFWITPLTISIMCINALQRFILWILSYTISSPIRR